VGPSLDLARCPFERYRVVHELLETCLRSCCRTAHLFLPRFNGSLEILDLRLTFYHARCPSGNENKTFWMRCDKQNGIVKSAP
jgi:hypothetical protein